MTRTRSGFLALIVGCVGFLPSACATVGPAAVSPGEIPSLEERLSRDPQNGELLLRYAAALMADGRCLEAEAAAGRGRELRPADPVGALVVGRCFEEAGRYEEAIAVYAEYQDAYGERPEARVVEAQRSLALRRRAEVLAREALRFEDSLAAVPADPEVVAVLPLVIDGPPEYEPLSVGLAHMIITDLSLLDRFDLVERVRLGAVLDELELGRGERVDPATAARAGRLARAARIVQGSAAIPSEEEAQLEGTLLLSSGEVVEPHTLRGAFRDLVAMEKDLVIRLAGSLGYQLSEAERQRILESGTRNLMAFLAFSRGLLAEDRGDYGTAAALYAEAATLDPGFTEAVQRREVSVAAELAVASSPGDVVTLPSQVAQVLTGGVEVELPIAGSALTSSVLDIASMQAERASRGAGQGDALRELIQLTGTSTVVPPLMVEAIIQIILRIPG